MSPPQPYTPIDAFPDLDGSGGGGPLTLAEDGDAYLYKDQVRCDADIQSIANTTPIQVTTATAHLLVTGNKVTIVGADVSAANGTFTITKISGSVFSLNGTTAAGAGGAFGRVFNAKLGIISRLIDATAYLGKRLLGSAYTSGIVSMQGRKVLRRPRVSLTGNNQTIDVTQGDRFVAPSGPGTVPCLITIKHTSPAVPTANEVIDVVWNTAGGAVGGGEQYRFKREDGTIIASFYGPQSTIAAGCWAEFEYSGGVWRLGANSGPSYDGDDYGVIQGASA